MTFSSHWEAAVQYTNGTKLLWKANFHLIVLVPDNNRILKSRKIIWPITGLLPFWYVEYSHQRVQHLPYVALGTINIPNMSTFHIATDSIHLQTVCLGQKEYKHATSMGVDERNAHDEAERCDIQLIF